jgi:GDP-4-dehydro-6-deoxy-D-mannose reductase
VSSSAVYGIQNDIQPLSESARLLPSGHYGLSKVFQERIADFYFRNYGLDIIIARPFNFTGPREYPLYVSSDFVRQIIDIENNKNKPIIRVGNLENRRDFTDVRDIVKAYEQLAQKGITGEIYNLCSGYAYSIKTILDTLLSLSKTKITIESDPVKISAGNTNCQLGSNLKITSQTGWKPEIPLDKTLEDMLNYHRKLNKL